MPEISFDVDSASLATLKDLEISANFDQCKAALTEMMTPYAGMVVTADGITDAKSTRAKIRKIATRIDDARKTIKKIYSEPLTQFENRCKELTGICTAASDNLDGQIKAYEKARADEKLANIKAYFDGRVGELKRFITWENIQNPRWVNVSFNADAAIKEIDAALEGVESDVATIRSLNSEFELTLLDYYSQSRDLGLVMRKSAQLTAQKAADENRRRMAREEEERKVQLKAVQNAAPTPTVSTTAEAAEDEKMTVLDFRVWVTAKQMQNLRNFLQEQNIKFGRVPKE